MKQDTFWKHFWIITSTVSLLCVVASTSIFVYHISHVDASAVGASFDPNKDPFEFSTYKGSFAMINGSLYRDAFPLRLEQWYWDSKIDWRSSEQVHEGTGSLKVVFNKAWAGMGLSGFSANRANFGSITLSVYPDASVGDLYIEVYNQHGTALTRQSIGWYAEGGLLLPNMWQTISIPLENLVGPSGATTITAISLSSMNAGTAYFDDIQFTEAATAHSMWAPKLWEETPPFNPFATSTPTLLPYQMEFTRDSLFKWYTYYGFADFINGVFKIGPQAPASNDVTTVFRGGKLWGDYQVEAVADWGLTSTFSLLVRVQDAQNYTACAYSYYGQTVQVYQVTNGVSRELGQSPGLPTKYDAPWQDVKVSARVEGKTISCYAGGEKILTYQIPEMPTKGTVGFEAWDKNAYASPHAIKAFEVHALLGE